MRKAVKVIDGTLKDYSQRIDHWTSRQGWLTSLAKIETSEKFRDGVAQPIAGCTLITPPHGESERCSAVYSEIHNARSTILEMLGVRFNLVPRACLHVTAADVLSGAQYESVRLSVPDLEVRLRDRMSTLFDGQAKLNSPLEWQVSGLAFFQHALVAVLAPRSERDYAPIQRLRQDIYGDGALRALGVKTPLPFVAHVTLGYYEEVPPPEIRQGWLNKYRALQTRLGLADGAFMIDCLDLRWFKDMTAYHRYEPNVGVRFGPEA